MSKKKKQPKIQRIPIPVRGGIRTQLGRMQTSRNWWTKEWFAYVESLKIGARLGRGRSYAATGQATELSICPGAIEASVQGGSPGAYRCRISVEPVTELARAKIIRRLRANPIVMAQLMINNLPQAAERIFRAEGFPLIPTEANPICSSCSCPDYANPCKHIAAIFFLLAEAIDNRPAILLELRGVSIADILVGGQKGKLAVSDECTKLAKRNHTENKDFWTAGEIKEDTAQTMQDYQPPAPLIQRLGSIPFWRGEQKFLDAMRQCAERIR